MMPSLPRLAQSVMLLVVCPMLRAAEPAAVALELTGEALEEASGLVAASPGGYWAHNDSGHAALLFHVEPDSGRSRALPLPLPPLRDWEDIAAMRWQGRTLLILADVGDNRGRREQVRLHFIEEPQGGDAAVRLVHSLALRYPDGPRDCEAVAFDPVDERIYLLSKRDRPPRLYSLAAGEALSAAALVARFERELRVLSEAADWGLRGLRPLTYAPTAMDIAPDGAGILVLNYLEAYWWPRRADQRLADVLSQAPRPLGRHGLPQAEGIGFSPDGNAAMVISEQLPTRLLRLPLGPAGPMADNPAPETDGLR